MSLNSSRKLRKRLRESRTGRKIDMFIAGIERNFVKYGIPAVTARKQWRNLIMWLILDMFETSARLEKSGDANRGKGGFSLIWNCFGIRQWLLRLCEIWRVFCLRFSRGAKFVF
ncbi:hypothetical protein Zmor_013236 [Zophobas morio]|uniref:Uncharacterized protein n=1 Tax=Zophobas morio TaxID=2755281 RepID=A0AA38MF02_9CUCU|nr:hypothetical protein Zmor_013236 [Zophobas morio]